MQANTINQQNIGFELLHEKRLLPLILQIKEYNSENDEEGTRFQMRGF
jgi:hypothetical protein